MPVQRFSSDHLSDKGSAGRRRNIEFECHGFCELWTRNFSALIRAPNVILIPHLLLLELPDEEFILLAEGNHEHYVVVGVDLQGGVGAQALPRDVGLHPWVNLYRDYAI